MLKTGTLVYCEYSYCRILYGVKVGNEKMPIKLFIAFHADIITEIDISVSHYTVAKYFHFLQRNGTDWNIGRRDR